MSEVKEMKNDGMFFIGVLLLIAAISTCSGCMGSTPKIDVEDRLLTCVDDVKEFHEKVDKRRSVHELKVTCK